MALIRMDGSLLQIDRASAIRAKLSAADKASDTETPDEFGYTLSKSSSLVGFIPFQVLRSGSAAGVDGWRDFFIPWEGAGAAGSILRGGAPRLVPVPLSFPSALPPRCQCSGPGLSERMCVGRVVSRRICAMNPPSTSLH